MSESLERPRRRRNKAAEGNRAGHSLALSDRWMVPFLEKLRQDGNIGRACESARISRSTVIERRKSNPAFAEAYDEALDNFIDACEVEAHRRAVDGYDRPIFQAGQLVGHQRIYSDTLLMFLLNGNRPQKYRPNDGQHAVAAAGQATADAINALIVSVSPEPKPLPPTPPDRLMIEYEPARPDDADE